jgi:hypothetical protein
MFTAVGVFGLLAGGAVAAPQAAMDGKTAAQTNAYLAPPQAASAPQQFSPIGGASITTLTGGAQLPGSFSNPNSTVLGGWFGPASVGGTFQAGLIGGTMNGQFPTGGRMSGVIVGGAISPGLAPGGALTGRPAGGLYGTNLLGGIGAPNNSFTAGSRGVIVGGAQTAGASPGGVLVSGASTGGVLVAGASPGGVLVAGAPPNTNAAVGTITGATGGQLH